jgi:glycosyltransferase involved in cell wall biosynthesis
MSQDSPNSRTKTPLVKRAWFKRLRYRLIPAKSRPEHELWMTVKSLRERRYLIAAISVVKLCAYILLTPLIRFFEPAGLFAGEPYFQDNTRVVLYTNDARSFPDYQPRRLIPTDRQSPAPVTLITTLYNEIESVEAWFHSLAQQSRLPDEMVVVDAGSTDGTQATLQKLARTSPFPIRLVVEPGANIARGRNLAIRHAAHPLIACTDLGCRVDSRWLELITAPFDDDPLIQVVSGWFETVKPPGYKMQLLGMTLDDVNPQTFLPSSRSIAFRREAWEKVGGYPEWVTLTGEDTFFDYELKKACRHWAFVPQAVVQWHAPASLPAYWRKLRGWATGDGESLFGASLYWHSLARLVLLALALLLGVGGLAWAAAAYSLPPLAALAIALAGAYLLGVLSFSARVVKPVDLVSELGAEAARVQGFLAGARRRSQALSRRYQDAKGFFFILAGVPIDDTGGGARCTQIALELLRQGYAVFYINRFPKYESVELDLVIYHPLLYTSPFSYFRWKAFLRNYAHILSGKPVGALVEFPMAEFLPTLRGIRQAGGVVVYDLLDDWNTSLGGDWYSLPTEKDVIAASQVLVATETSLQERLRRLSQRPVALVPNAVNSRLFDPDQSHPRPGDFPTGDWAIIYIGALWGQWFDWKLLTEIACAYPKAALVVIGDYHGQCANPPANLHFLGLKAQRSLPAYLAHAQVAIIPWIVSPITQATSPLKVYEYLTMRKPVVAPDLRPLHGLPGVFLAQDSTDFIAQIDIARQAHLPAAELAAFTAQNDWAARVKTILKLVEAQR